MLKPYRLNEIKTEAFREGLNDTLTDEILCNAALAYIDSNITQKVTSKEQTQIINEYIKGFISGYSFNK